MWEQNPDLTQPLYWLGLSNVAGDGPCETFTSSQQDGEMTYWEARETIKGGDVLLSRRSKFIRVFTGESFSHVGMFFWMDGGLWVAEYVWPRFRIVPASELIAEHKGQQWIGRSHLDRFQAARVRDRIMEFRADESERKVYAWWTFPLIWLSDLFGSKKRWVRRGYVCSIFVQEIWRRCGYELESRDGDATPGDVANDCWSFVRIDR